MVNKSTNIHNMNWRQINTTTYNFGNAGTGLRKGHIYDGVKPVLAYFS